MDCPLFLVPCISGSWLIGATAILHVIIAHLAHGCSGPWPENAERLHRKGQQPIRTATAIEAN